MRTLAAIAFAAIVAGCGGGNQLLRGRVVFQHDCARCHTLTGRDTSAVGGDLRLGRLDAAAIASFARVMPVAKPLGAADIRAVAAYVARR